MSYGDKDEFTYRGSLRGINISLKVQGETHSSELLTKLINTLISNCKGLINSHFRIEKPESEMVGTIRSSSFEVKNADEFFNWFTNNVFFGNNIALSRNGAIFSFSGRVRNPSAHPYQILEERSEMVPWDLDEFTKEIQKHLFHDQEFRVLAVGTDQTDEISCVVSSYLKITHEGYDHDTYCEGE